MAKTKDVDAVALRPAASLRHRSGLRFARRTRLLNAKQRGQLRAVLGGLLGLAAAAGWCAVALLSKS